MSSLSVLSCFKSHFMSVVSMCTHAGNLIRFLLVTFYFSVPKSRKQMGTVCTCTKRLNRPQTQNHKNTSSSLKIYPQPRQNIIHVFSNMNKWTRFQWRKSSRYVIPNAHTHFLLQNDREKFSLWYFDGSKGSLLFKSQLKSFPYHSSSLHSWSDLFQPHPSFLHLSHLHAHIQAHILYIHRHTCT